MCDLRMEGEGKDTLVTLGSEQGRRNLVNLLKRVRGREQKKYM